MEGSLYTTIKPICYATVMPIMQRGKFKIERIILTCIITKRGIGYGLTNWPQLYRSFTVLKNIV